ncbi:hypothetical protein O6P43_006029 [Quillaja saponaria]|uniref:Uncharacterized protein n=1 Tax=Quillaja saponaria TaxID=32244 RepID=A0AAD7Q7C5_QUISA|nr:hypothetical protein O6P43_006029 [Quillaja saponaria]
MPRGRHPPLRGCLGSSFSPSTALVVSPSTTPTVPSSSTAVAPIWHLPPSAVGAPPPSVPLLTPSSNAATGHDQNAKHKTDLEPHVEDRDASHEAGNVAECATSAKK